ncbi:MAG: hypothetical protein V2I97_03835 [Desulfococcaceae bacterium]|jgi:hypothetical protein|nr:hypothetical protein [Desulfococcaceae bacterium]
MTGSKIRLDLNDTVFQEQLFNLPKVQQRTVLSSLRKISKMTWNQVYQDSGLKWEAILSRSGPHGGKLYSFRLGKGFRAITYRDKDWMRLLSLHPDHDSAYR